MMKRFHQLPAASVLVFVFLATVKADEFAAPPITVADGFEVSIAAAPPLVKYPMMACFDDRGRLYIAESDGRNLTTKEEIEKELPRFVRRLVDTDDDGVFDQSTIFADKMTMPEGGLWYDGALYIISAPYLWRLEDTDDDGVADKREKVLGYMEFDGRANQHGPYFGPNGRFYFTGGHFGFEFEGTDGSKTGKSRAAGVFSCWPDGSDVRVEGQGGINPVDVAFTENGEMLTTCPIFDSFDGRHDALIHWVRGGLTQVVYGVPVILETGLRLPAMSRWGQVAPAGLMRYRGTQFGEDYSGTFFACHFNTQRVVHVRPVKQGATFTTVESDFLSSTNIDFHPTDILEDADGSLLLLDTGGWLSWGCPHSKLAKPEVKGAIYRIRKKDSTRPEDPRGEQIDWGKVGASLLADLRPAVRDRATEALVKLGEEAVQPLREQFEKANTVVQKRCLWALSRIGSESARVVLRSALQSSDAGVRQVAARSLGMLKDRQSESRIVGLLEDGDAAVRRMAATALGQIGAADSVPALLGSLHPNSELYFQHAVTYALIEIGEMPAAFTEFSESDPPHVKKAVLRVLDETDSDLLKPEKVISLLKSNDLRLKEEAQRVIAGRPGWKDAVMSVFADLLDDTEPSPLIESIVLSFANDEAFHATLRDGFAQATTTDAVRAKILASLGFLPELPEPLHELLKQALASDVIAVRGESIALLRKFRPRGTLMEPLQAIATDQEESRELRSGAIAALVANNEKIDDASFEFMVGLVRDPDVPPSLGLQAARALGTRSQSVLKPERIRTICGLFADASPLEVPHLLPVVLNFSFLPRRGMSATSFSFDEKKAVPIWLGAALEKRVETGLGGLEQNIVADILSAFPHRFMENPVDFAEILDIENKAGAVDHEAKLKALLDGLPEGNASRGRVLFQSNRATCSLCHRVGEKGGTLGPDLSKIGRIRSRRDLLEAIAFPSATVVNGYENYLIETTGGATHAGLIQRETAESVFLMSADLEERRVARSDIAKMERSPVSAMPQGLDKLFSKEELADLLAFLEACK